MEGRDDRGAAPVIGFILIFSFLVLAFTIYQGVVVPDQNRRAEFEHNQQVQGSIQELRNAIMSAATSETERTVSIKLGAEYPQRTIAQNLGFSSGALRTTTYAGAEHLRIANATAIDRYGETSDYWTGTREHAYETKALIYRPIYSFYSNAPETIYANTLAYNQFRNANLTITGQSLVDGNRITLVSLVGNVSKGQSGTVSVDPEAISASTTRVAIKGDGADPINITIPTQLNGSWWNDVLAEEFVDEGGHVRNVKNASENAVSIILEADANYVLRMAKIGVGTGTSDEPATYLTLNERPSKTVFNGTSHSITVEVRDRFNNPVSGVQVNASILGSNNGTFEDDTINTSVGGEATFNYTAPDAGGKTPKLQFNVTPLAGGHPSYEIVWVNLSVRKSGRGTSSPGPGGSGAYDVDWVTNAGNDITITADNQSSVERNLTAKALIRAKGLNFDYAVNNRTSFWNSTFVSVTPEEGITNGTGYNSTTLRATKNGTWQAYVVSGGTKDLINVTVDYEVYWTEGADVTIDAGGSDFERIKLTTNASLFTGGLPLTYSLNDTTNASIDPVSGLTNTTGQNTTVLNVTANVTRRVTVTSAGKTDTINVTVNNIGSGGGAPVRNIQASTGTTVGNNAGVEFVLENTGSADATITAIAINSTSNSASSVDEPDGPAQFWYNKSGGINLYTSTITVVTDGGSAVTLDTTATIEAGEAYTFQLDKFKQNADGSGPPQDMRGTTVEITLFFSDGSSASITLTP